jgi:cytochrome c-type biogenesis protein CcmH
VRLVGPTLRRTDALLLLAVAAVAGSMALAAFAPRPGTLDDRARAIEGQLRCPTCQGLSIADSPATSATQMRELVREQLGAGASDEEVRAFFVARYGRWVLLDPRVAGMDLALWLVPPLVLLIGALVVVRRARARSAGGAATPGWGAPLAATGRLPTIAIAAGMVLALAVPIAAAVGPRLAGQEVTGRPVSQAAPSIEELEAIVQANPDHVESVVALADALLSANRPGEAVERYKAALELDANNVPALLGVGTILLAADRADAAGPVFDRVLALSPDQADALLYRAVARLRLEGSATDQVRADVERFLALAAADDPRRPMAAGLLEGAAPSGSPPSAPSRSP